MKKINSHDEQPQKKYLVPAVDQAIRVLLCLVDGGSNPTSLTDICEEVGIHRSKAFSILNTLSEYDLVKKNPNRKGYVLGPGLLTLTGKMFESLSLSRLVEPVLFELAKKAEATVRLGVIADDKAYIIAQYEGATGFGLSAPIGHVTPVSYGAHGLAIAAFLPEDELEEFLNENKPYYYGSPEQFDEERFRIDIARARRDGFAVEYGELMPGVSVIASPILDQTGRPVFYIVVAGFFTESDLPRLGPLVINAVKAISKDVRHMTYWPKTCKRRK